MRVSLGVVALLMTVTLAGCASVTDSETDSGEAAVVDDFMPRVVVAIIDTGLQPYHDEFRQVRAGEDPFAHPATYLPGYPADAEAIPITLELNGSTAASDYLEADRDLWDATEAEKLYWVPGTKTIGFIGFGGTLPGSGHGTMTSGRAVGNTISIGGNETLLVNVHAPLSLETDLDGDSHEGVATRWVADQPWIDIQSHSWGDFIQCGDYAYNQFSGWSESFKYARDKQLVFVAAANGYANSGTLGYPSQCQSNNPAGVITVGANDNQGYPTWANWFPAVSGDGCANPAPAEATTNEISNTGGGTSSATPFSAGGAAKLILEARRTFRDPGVGIHDGVITTVQEGGTVPDKGPLSDGDFTMDELKDVLFHTARFPELDDSDGGECLQRLPFPEGTPQDAVFPFIGYGEVNGNSIDHAIQVIHGAAQMYARPEADQMYAQDQESRRAMYG